MLNTMTRLSAQLFPIRHLFTFLGLVVVGFLVYIILISKARYLDIYILPLICAFGWCVSLFGIAVSFRNPLPEIQTGDGFFRKLKIRIYRFINWFWSLSFLVITGMMFYISYKAFKMALA